MKILYIREIDPDRLPSSSKDGGLTVVNASPNWVAPSTKTEANPEGKPFKDLTGDEIPIAWEELAQKVVPKGLKYKIVEDSEVSTDRSFRNAWEIDESELTDGVGTWEPIAW
tara:strand:- start:152 stop:487 length:336 start_codon:yes stop_codon:yes gene_type:complete